MIKDLKEHQESFSRKKYTVINGFLDPDALDVYAAYVEDQINAGHWELGDSQVYSRLYVHNEPISRYLHATLAGKIEEVVGCNLLPTYVYTVGYLHNSMLPRHLDRPACEISASLTLFGDGEKFPIFVNSPEEDEREKKPCPCDATSIDMFPNEYKGEEIDPRLSGISDHPLGGYKEILGNEIRLNPGDALIYEGQTISHWRNRLQDMDGFASLLLHYVREDGEYRGEYMAPNNHGWLKKNRYYVPRVFDQNEEP